MKKGGKVAVVHILFLHFWLPRYFIFPPQYLSKDHLR